MGLGKADVDVEVGRGRVRGWVGEYVSDRYNCLLWLMGADIQIGRATLELNGESLLMQILEMCDPFKRDYLYILLVYSNQTEVVIGVGALEMGISNYTIPMQRPPSSSLSYPAP